jgi:hypothetical protein
VHPIDTSLDETREGLGVGKEFQIFLELAEISDALLRRGG